MHQKARILKGTLYDIFMDCPTSMLTPDRILKIWALAAYEHNYAACNKNGQWMFFRSVPSYNKEHGIWTCQGHFGSASGYYTPIASFDTHVLGEVILTRPTDHGLPNPDPVQRWLDSLHGETKCPQSQFSLKS